MTWRRQAGARTLQLAAMALVAAGGAWAQPSAPPAPPALPAADGPPGTVTVVVAVQLVSNTEPAEALVAVNDMRALMKRQPGYLTDALLQNLNPDNAPRYVHVSRWASMAHWAALFGTPEFSRLSAHGNSHYRISASAFVPAD